MAEYTYYGGFSYDYDGLGFDAIGIVRGLFQDVYTVSDGEADYNAKMLLPAVVRLGGGLLKTFCKDIGCGYERPAPNNSRNQTNPDDNFDVSSRLIELEELDITKQAWKDLYGRTGIKKGYNGLFLEKTATEAYARLASTTTETDYNAAAQQFQSILDRAQKEAKHSFEDTYYAAADVALLSDAFVDNAAELLLKRLKEPIREVKETLTPAALLKNQPVLLIPSGALTGFNDSPMLKASLDEYVKQGGTLIVLSQKHGYDYASIPTPDGKPITAYGWEEDINCFADAFTIETWHQLLAGQSSATPTANVDGYFTSIPDNSTVLLRRTANGQPALFMYDHGQGRVIVTSMYSDWAYGHGQASQAEIALIRDMLSWAKKPAQLPEINPGEALSVPVTITNSTATDAATVKLQIYTPDRSALLVEQSLSLSLPAGQSAETTVNWQSSATSQLGIYHIDYLLLDAFGTIIQPQAETDSGRFAVSKPPTDLVKIPDYNFAVNSDSERYAFGADAAFTATLYNSTDTEKTVTAKYFFPHHYWETGRADSGGDWGNREMNLQKTLTVPAKGFASFSHVLTNVSANVDRLWAYFYDDAGKQIGSASRGFWVFRPAVKIGLQSDKTVYTRGDSVNLTLSLQNKQSVATTTKITLRVSDPVNLAVYVTTLTLTLVANEAKTESLSFVLPTTAQGGMYTISAEAFDAANTKIGGDSAAFEIPLRFVAVTSNLPAALTPGTNTVPFSLVNLGILPVASGSLNVTLNDPDGAVVTKHSQLFSLAAGQSMGIDVPLAVPPLKFGIYALTHTQSDESQSGKAVIRSLPNSVATAVSFDKPFYRIRETANLTATIINSGNFNLDNVSVTLSVPDAGYTDTRMTTIGQGQTLPLQYAVPLPDTLTAGQHTVSVTLTLAGGSAIVRSFTFPVPQSSLALALAQTAYPAASTISPAINNSGGVDTGVEYRISLYDAKSTLTAEKSSTETVPAGGTLAPSLPIPAGAVAGNYTLVVTYTDVKRGKTDLMPTPLTITGIKAALTLRSDKQSYLTSESVTALSSIANSGTDMQGGDLHLQVTTAGGNQLKKSWSSQYDFQQGTRSGVDTFDSPGTVTLLAFADSFSGGILNTDRWTPGVIGGTFPYLENGQLNLSLPAASTWIRSFVNSNAIAYGDFDATVNYSVDTVSYYNGNNHPAGLQVYMTNPYLYLWVDIWGSPLTYGSSDNGYGSANASGASFTGSLRIKRTGKNYFSYYWNGSSWVNLLSSYNRPAGPTQFRLIDVGPTGKSIARFDNFAVASQVYNSTGTILLKADYGRFEEWGTLSFDAEVPEGTALSFRTRAAETEAGLTTASWSSPITANGAAVTSPKGRWLEVEAAMSTANTVVTPVLKELTITQGHNPGQIIWQADIPVNMAQNATADLSDSIGTMGAAGKYYLQGTLTSSSGQTVATAEYPFFVAQGNTLLSFSSDKRIYKPGETVTINGEVKNMATVEAANLNLSIKEKPADSAEQARYTATFTIPAGGSSPFTVTTTAGAEGVAAIIATATQNNLTLAEIADQYEVASPKMAAALTAPDVAGDDPFNLTLNLTNSGKTEAAITLLSSITSLPEIITIPAGQTKLLQYSQQISADTIDTFSISGDLTQTITKTVKYGPAVSLAVAPQSIYPEGMITLPVTVSNSGLIDSQYTVNYQLTQGANSINQLTKNYFILKGANSSDSLILDLPEGSYQLAATSQQPAVSAPTSFQVRKEAKAELALAVGNQSNSLLSATVNVTNLGYNPVDGCVRITMTGSDGIAVWTATQEVSLPQMLTPAPQNLAFSINLSTLKPGIFTVKAELLDTGNRQLASQSAPFSLLGPIFTISQLPLYRTIPSGGRSDFTFKVKNSGNQEGSFDLLFKADDLINATRSEWLKPGEEKELTFALQTAGDLEEKDYFASYSLKSQGTGSEPQAGLKEQGTVRYRLLGLNLAVTAALDRQAYSPGDMATFTVSVSQQDAGAAPNLFARVNYNGYNEKQTFALNGNQTLTFTVPLPQITGEKFFYGIYTETGRSIHLNTSYLRQADAVLAIATDKQVYNPGETVTATISGTAAGDLTLTGPGDFSTTFAYSGADTKSFTLPATMTAGTYMLNAQLKTHNSQLITVSYPFDVSGIQVKVKEALLDRVKYAATDTIQLSLNIESNRDLPATVRTWVVDPSGTYIPAGEAAVNLTSAAPLLSTLNAQLSTTSLGIHKLVYGIYQGDLLLASGAKAFDIGEAVLLSLATDRSDYPELTLPVNVKADLYGTTAAGIELFLDGASINTGSVVLSGMESYTFTIPPAGVTPGLHSLKAVLTVGGLTSARETRFTSGSTRADLTARISSQPPAGGSVNLSITVANQGKTLAGASLAALYDGSPANGGQLLATLNVPAIAAGSSVTLPYAWNILGKSGDHVLYAIADSDNSVVEFIEANNTAMTAVSLPSFSLAVTTAKGAYDANESVAVMVSLANLTANLPLEGSTLKLWLTSADGTTIDLADKVVGIIAPATITALTEAWNTGIAPPSGYTVTARLVSGTTELASASSAFTVMPTTSLAGSIVPFVAEVPQDSSLTALFTISNSGNIPLDGRLQGVINDPQNGSNLAVQEIPLQLPLSGTKTGTFSLPLTGLPIKGYDLLLRFGSTGSETIIAQAQFTIKDTIPPILAVSTLSDGSFTNLETLNVAGTVQDNSGNVQVEINGVIAPVAVDGSFSSALLLNSGANTISTVAIDGANNTASDTRTITLDQNAPELTITSPADNSRTALSPVEVKGSVAETSTVKVKVKENVQNAAMNGTAFSAIMIPEPGWNTIEVTATDPAGNQSSQKRSVLFDDRKPSLAVTEPPQDIRTNKNSLTVSGTATDLYTAVGVTVSLDGTILTPPVIGDIFSQVVTFPTEKLYPLTVTATNEMGTQTSVQRNVIYDKTPPNLSIDPVVTPTNVSTQTVSGTREDGTAVSVTTATATVGSVEYPSTTSWRVLITGLQQGENRLQAESTDLAGNRTIATATILYVPKSPSVTISASPNQLWPPNKKMVPVTITGDVASFGSDIKEVTISVADEYGKYNLPGLTFGDTVQLEAWRDGNDTDGRVYTITAVVTDQAGNRTTRSTTVVVPHDMGG